jgi:FMN-dependent oxidoreductase (nitrilotriacetate monooxygenase family)
LRSSTSTVSTALPPDSDVTQHVTFHLVASLMTPGHFRAAWRLPHNHPTDWLSIDHFQRLARIADDAGLHAIFLGDAPALSPDIVHNPGNGIDPLVLLGNLAAITTRVGVLITSSATYNSPYNLARRFQALDIVTKGWTAVNIVTTYAPDAAANFGLAEPLDKETRYRRAYEFLSVVQGLWSGWEPDAIVADKAAGIYADGAKIHSLDHEGEFFSVAGTLSVPAGPQGWPVVVQAGGSEAGLRLGSELADVIFTVAQTIGKAITFRDDIRARAAAAGRNRDHVKVSLGVIVLVGETDDDLRQRREALLGTLPIDDLARGLLDSLGLPDRSLDDPIRADDVPAEPLNSVGSTGFQISTRALLAEQPLSAREFIRHTAGISAGGHRLVAGTPEQIADDLEAWFKAGAADGFTIMYADTSVDFERFARLVVPLLIQRGLVKAAEEGATLREHLALPLPNRRRAQQPQVR